VLTRFFNNTPQENRGHDRAVSKLAVALAAAGGGVWLLLLVASSAGLIKLSAIEALFLLAPLVTVPLSLNLIREATLAGAPVGGVRPAIFLQPVGAVAAVLSFEFLTGAKAAGFASVWLVVCALASLGGFNGLLRGGFRSLEALCLNCGLAYFTVGGIWFCASRLGMPLMGFEEPLVLLTGVHFHFAGLSAPVLAGMVGLQGDPANRLARKLFIISGSGAAAGPALLAAGFALGSPDLRLIAALILAASMTALGVCQLNLMRKFQSRSGAFIAGIAVASIVVSMLFAVIYSAGEAAKHPILTIPQMAVFHGIANGPGFVLCSLIAWTIALRRQQIARPLIRAEGAQKSER
jgi:YndJ-like protein